METTTVQSAALAVRSEPALTCSEIEAAANGWEPHRGGPCPLQARTLVLIRLRFETFYDDSQMPRFARAWAGWVHEGSEMDVVAYKVARS